MEDGRATVLLVDVDVTTQLGEGASNTFRNRETLVVVLQQRFMP